MKKLLLIGGLVLCLCSFTIAQKIQSPEKLKTPRRTEIGKTVLPLNTKVKAPAAKYEISRNNSRNASVVELTTVVNFITDDYGERAYRFATKETGRKEDGSTGFAVVYNAFSNEDNMGDYSYMYTTNSVDWEADNLAYIYDEASFPRGVALNAFVHGNDEDGIYTSYLTSPVTKQNFNFGDFAVGSALLGEDVDNQRMDPNLLYNPDENEIYNNQVNWAFQIKDRVFGVYRNMDFELEPSGESAYLNYRDQLILVKGKWNNETKVVDYEQKKLNTPEGMFDKVGPYWMHQPVFTADGQIGYVVGVHSAPEDDQNTDKYFYIWRTEDGGDTWSEEPQIKSFTGSEVLPLLKDLIPNSDVYDEIIARNPSQAAASYSSPEDLVWYKGFDYNMNIDKNGELHLFVYFNMMYASEQEGYINYGLGPNSQVLAHIYTSENGTKWNSQPIQMGESIRLYFLAGEDGFMRFGYTLGHTPKIITNEDQDKLVFVWTDTHVDWEAESVNVVNTNPIIFGAIYDLNKKKFIEQSAGKLNDYGISVVELSKNTPADTKAFSIETPFTFIQNNSFAEIPIAYSNFANDDPENFSYREPRIINYLSGAKLDLGKVGLNDNISESLDFKLSQNVPNPCSGITKIGVDLTNESDVMLEIVNMKGQKVIQMSKEKNIGHCEFNVNVSQLSAGVYFYTVKCGEKQLVKKMVVE
ncbi:MAG: T9SS type A sorting domain-containing protein [Bacteroidales bacterium]